MGGMTPSDIVKADLQKLRRNLSVVGAIGMITAVALELCWWLSDRISFAFLVFPALAVFFICETIRADIQQIIDSGGYRRLRKKNATHD